ncbi:MAG: hypothetical protein LBQ73_10725 [Tannerellaceae bacterium]|jgi:hypothetical protein|nr:hypothetical protein [Tannerellaceae bacterium]
MKLISYKGMKAESLPALAQGNALGSKRTSVLRPERARASVRMWLLPLQGGENQAHDIHRALPRAIATRLSAFMSLYVIYSVLFN